MVYRVIRRASYNENIYEEIVIEGDNGLYTVRREKHYPVGSSVVRESSFTIRGGVARWNSNGSILMKDVVLDYGIDQVVGFDMEAHLVAYSLELDKFLKEYREQDVGPSAEQLAEMRAEFGVGSVVVDVLSGRKTQL